MKFGAHELHHTKYISFELDQCMGGSRPNWQKVVLSLWTVITLVNHLKCTYLWCVGVKTQRDEGPVTLSCNLVICNVYKTRCEILRKKRYPDFATCAVCGNSFGIELAHCRSSQFLSSYIVTSFVQRQSAACFFITSRDSESWYCLKRACLSVCLCVDNHISSCEYFDRCLYVCLFC